MIETIRISFQFPFVRYAMIVGVLIALCSSLLGVTLVLKRFSFIGDGLFHVAFDAMAVAGILNLTDEMRGQQRLELLAHICLHLNAYLCNHFAPTTKAYPTTAWLYCSQICDFRLDSV